MSSKAEKLQIIQQEENLLYILEQILSLEDLKDEQILEALSQRKDISYTLSLVLEHSFMQYKFTHILDYFGTDDIYY